MNPYPDEDRSDPHARPALLETVTRSANRADEVDEAVETALQGICDLTGWDVGHAYYWDEGDQVLRPEGPTVAAGNGELEAALEALAELPLLPGEGLPGRAWERREPLSVSDMEHTSEGAADPRADVLAETPLVGAFDIPLAAGDEAWGVLEVFSVEPLDPDEAVETARDMGTALQLFAERQRARQILVDAKEEAEAAGVDAYLTKPVEPEEIAREIRRIIPGDRRRDDSP